MRFLQRIVLRTGSGPLRPMWALVYEAAARLLGRVLRAGVRGPVATYATGSIARREVVPGASDVDVALVVPHASAAGVTARWHRLRDRLPVLAAAADVAVYEAPALWAGGGRTTYTYGVEDGGVAYTGPMASGASAMLLEGSGLAGPGAGWRRLAGPDLRPPPVSDAPEERRLRAWLSLQSWWRWTFAACAEPDAPWTPLHGPKIVAETLRILRFLDTGGNPPGRKVVLAAAADDPELAPLVRPALGSAPLSDVLPCFVALSSLIAEKITAATEPGVEVALAGAAPAPSLPLADWRAIVYPWFADEVFRPDPRDPSDPAQLRAAARDEANGPYLGLRSGPLLVLPTARLIRGLGRMRAVHCRVTAPVVFALLDGRATATFPDHPGWSAPDLAARAVAEHRAALAELNPNEPFARAQCLNAARAAVFADSLRAGEPVLPLTSAATLERLPQLDSAGPVGELRDAVRRLPGLAGD